MDTAKTRLLEFLKVLKIGQSKFEASVGISNGYINSCNGTIGSGIVEKISAKYPELNTAWLVTGKGSMFDEKVVMVDPEQKKILDIVEKFQAMLNAKDEEIKRLRQLLEEKGKS